MENNLKLCMGCMGHKEYSGPCEICGYMDNTAYLPSYLAPKTVLMNRYIVGRLLSHNGEGAVYIAYDTEKNKVNELGCWDPTTETLTLTVEGEEVTKTWQDWSGCMIGSGDMANKSFETKLQILADMEENYMNFFYRIPLASSTAPFLMSYQCNQYTPDYNIMYGFGGIELMTFNYTDAEWDEFVKANNNDLSAEYKKSE